MLETLITMTVKEMIKFILLWILSIGFVILLLSILPSCISTRSLEEIQQECINKNGAFKITYNEYLNGWQQVNAECSYNNPKQ